MKIGTASWPTIVNQNQIISIVLATLSLYDYVQDTFKPTPVKFSYRFNMNHVYKILLGMCDIDS